MSQLLKSVLVFSLIWLTACGYQLRGSMDMPETLKSVYVVNASSLLQTEMVSLLKASKANLAPTMADSGVVIKILKEDIKNRVVSIGTTGKSTESEVDYYLRFQFFDSKDHPLMDEQTLDLSREFFNDQTAVLAKSSEEQMIRSEIYKQAARLLMARARIAIEAPK